MYHFMYDSFKGYRSRLDDIHLVYEILEEIPFKLGLKTIMPPFVLPYYNGVSPEDCGISAFVFLKGGHFSLHTFSFRETLFIDILYPEKLDIDCLNQLIENIFPYEKKYYSCVERGGEEISLAKTEIDIKNDFGPHVLVDFQKLNKPSTLDTLFDVFDSLPFKIGMTPIMRPYAVKNNFGKQTVLSVMTMIAESHISLHLFLPSGKAFFDLFSCSFFDYGIVGAKLKRCLKGRINNEKLISRGCKYKQIVSNPDSYSSSTRKWHENVYCTNGIGKSQ